MSSTRKHRRINELRPQPSSQDRCQYQSAESESMHYLQSKTFPDTGTEFGHGFAFSSKKPSKTSRSKQEGISDTHYSLLKFTVGSLLGLAYFMYVSNLFESVTKFSHLSELERELSLPPDVAFRYSYFKRLSESDTFSHGFMSSLNDSQDASAPGNICSLTRLVNPFRSHLLTAEVLQGGAFHLVKRFKRWTLTATSKFSTCQYRRHYEGKEESFSTQNPGSDTHSGASRSSPTRTAFSPKSKTKDDEQVQIEKVGDEVEKGDGDGESWTRTCFESANLFYFYANSIWVAESFAIILLFHFGCTLSKSIFGGGVSVLIFLVIHPQRTSSEWIFSFENKIEWVAFLSQICIVSQTVLRSSTQLSPSWTATVKVALSTATVFLISAHQAQWLLIAQLAIITGMEIFGVINSYIASLVLFGQLTGWQYATMVLLDTSFGTYSPFLCMLAACIVTVYVAQPALERRGRLVRLLGNRLLRAACLLVASQVFLHAFAFVLVTVAGNGNVHCSWSFFTPAMMYNSAKANCGGQSEPVNNNNNIIKIPAQRSETLDFHSEESSRPGLFLSSLLCSCNYPTLGYTREAFLSKYVLHGLTSIYVIATGLILPISYYYYDSKMKISSGVPSDGDGDGNGNNGGTKIGSFPGTGTLGPDSTDGEGASNLSSQQLVSQAESFFINQSTPLITFNVLQLLSFAYFCTWLGKTWELMAISHLAALGSLLCDRERITFVFGTFNSRRPVFSNRISLHWCLTLGIFLSLLTKTKRASNEMFQNSRAKYEIGNKKIQDLTEAMKWIEAYSSTSNSCCLVGLELPLLYVHLTTRRSHIFHNYHYNLLDEMLLNANAPKENAAAAAFEDVYRLFSRRTSTAEYHSKLKAFNATHLFLSRESCAAAAKSPPITQHDDSSELLSRDDSLKKAAAATFSLLWSEKSDKENELGVHLKRSCDLGRVWDAVEAEGQEIAQKTEEEKSAPKRRKRGPGLKNVPNSNYVDEVELDDILCLRLINDPDIRPFKRVFENGEYTILTTTLSDPNRKRDNAKKKSTKAKSRSKNKNEG